MLMVKRTIYGGGGSSTGLLLVYRVQKFMEFVELKEEYVK
jgi:hypothetical protein